MVTVGLMIRVEAKSDKVAEVEAMLKAAVEHVAKENKAVVWLSLCMGPTTFAVIDVFHEDADRQAHLDANFGALRIAARALFDGSPSVTYTDVVSAVLQGAATA